MLLNHPDMEIDPDAEVLADNPMGRYCYPQNGIGSFQTKISILIKLSSIPVMPPPLSTLMTIFKQLRQDGVIPAQVRFQVCLPTPMASGFMYISPNALEAYFPVYERALMKALNDILSVIPHEDLALQWDICQEVLVFENYFPYRPDDYKQQIFAELGRLGNAVPEVGRAWLSSVLWHPER